MMHLLYGFAITYGGVGIILYGFSWVLYWSRNRRTSHTRWMIESVRALIRSTK